MQITNFQCITAQYIIDSKIKGKKHSDEILQQSQTENILCKLHSALLTATHFFTLAWFHSLLVTLLGRYPLILASLTSWVLQGNPGFNFTASHNGLSTRPPFRDTPDTCLASVTVVRCRGNFYNPFLPP